MYRLSIIVLSRQIACDQPWPAMAKDLCRRQLTILLILLSCRQVFRSCNPVNKGRNTLPYL